MFFQSKTKWIYYKTFRVFKCSCLGKPLTERYKDVVYTTPNNCSLTINIKYPLYFKNAVHPKPLDPGLLYFHYLSIVTKLLNGSLMLMIPHSPIFISILYKKGNTMFSYLPYFQMASAIKDKRKYLTSSQK